MSAVQPTDVRLDLDAHRFVLEVDGGTAFIDVRTTPDGAWALTHTEVPKELGGRGVGTALVWGALDIARAQGRQVLPFCPFIHAYIKRHQGELDLVSENYAYVGDLRQEG